MRLSVEKNGIFMTFELEPGKPVLLLHMGADAYEQDSLTDRKMYYTMQEIQATGESRLEHFGVGPSGTFPGNRMNFISYQESENEFGYFLEICTKDSVTGLSGKMMYQFFDGIPVFRCWNTVKNEGKEPIGLEMVSTYVQSGIADEQEEEIHLLIPHNSWQEEIQWREAPIYQMGYRTLPECGISSKRVQLRSIGSWSSGEYLPMGCLRNVTRGTMEFWQIEHNGPWNWEIQERDRKLAMVINGPDEVNHNWWKNLKPGEEFVTVPAAVGCVKGGIDETFSALTRYRRIIRRKRKDNRKLPIIFNDYMNCLWGEPTTEKELPIIDAAAEAGCEYYCIDAGWYTDENWWYKVGEWKPSAKRFPNGMKEVTDYIRKKGMIPGIWIEIEVMGTQCEIFALTPEQAAVWSYPMTESTREEIIFNYVNACLLRIHQSGHLGSLDKEKKKIVDDAFLFYRKLRKEIPDALPFWPLGLAKDGDDWMCLGLDLGEKKLLAVWRIAGSSSCELPLYRLMGCDSSVAIAFPKEDHRCSYFWNSEKGILKVHFPETKMARILEIQPYS